MGRSSKKSRGTSFDLLINIIETLEAQGLDRGEFQLHDYVDVDALEQILYSSNEDVEVQFTVEEIRNRSDTGECRRPRQQSSLPSKLAERP